MKILWLSNIILPSIAQNIGQKPSVYGGWLTGLSNGLLRYDGIELGVCFPNDNNININGRISNLYYFGYSKSIIKSDSNTNLLEFYFRNVIEEFKPDIIHIFGTENIHSIAMVKATISLGIINKVVVSIQGLLSFYAKHYYSGLSNKVINSYTLRDFIYHDNIKKGKEYFVKFGKFEVETLKLVNYIIGRTDWDKACTEKINPSADYYFCNETLRDEFYLHKWDIAKCQKYTIFISQASYPIKGFHFVLEALPDIIKEFPDTHVYVAGNDITKYKTLKDKLKITSYGKYINGLIMEYKLSDYITFTGVLSETEMCNYFLKANVFISASSIENSPNSVGEAMILGVPVVCSDVGGVKNLMTHEIEGFIYQHDAPYMLSYYVNKIFKDENIASKFSRNSRNRSIATHDKRKNTDRLRHVYNEIISKSEKNEE